MPKHFLDSLVLPKAPTKEDFERVKPELNRAVLAALEAVHKSPGLFNWSELLGKFRGLYTSKFLAMQVKQYNQLHGVLLFKRGARISDFSSQKFHEGVFSIWRQAQHMGYLVIPLAVNKYNRQHASGERNISVNRFTAEIHKINNSPPLGFKKSGFSKA